jgi:sarcosine oxidase, subunit beta
LAEDEETRWLTELFPSGVHTRPEGGEESQTILMLWEYQTKVMEPVWPPMMDDQYPEVALRGLAAMLPRMKEYFGRMPRPQLDGGYYTKTPENRPLVGPMGVDGAYVIGALSGYGIMSACGVGELLAAQIMGAELPSFAPAFALSRYEDSEYTKQLESWSESGQL